ncbi:MAG: response regulator transcription factor, partial [Clostridia bacterium]|nr:response regulator transcription factor [Clostridia bacterium]
MYKILIVDDDKNIVELLRLYLDKEGFETVSAFDGQEALAMFEAESPDLVLLDVMMPKMDGWQVCREIHRVSRTPVIMLTAKGETFDKVLGFDLGADDYVVKPFDAKEVLARVKAVLRRSDPREMGEKEVHYDKLTINLTNYQMIVNDKVVVTPPKELELIFHLASNPDQAFTRNQLL